MTDEFDNEEIATKAYEAPAKDFPHREREAPSTGRGELPHSANDKFWGKDAQRTSVDKAEIAQKTADLVATMNGNHKLRQYGREFICESCPHRHTVPINPNTHTLNHQGEIVAIDTDA